jgi:hypothetical protein
MGSASEASKGRKNPTLPSPKTGRDERLRADVRPGMLQALLPARG